MIRMIGPVTGNLHPETCGFNTFRDSRYLYRFPFTIYGFLAMRLETCTLELAACSFNAFHDSRYSIYRFTIYVILPLNGY
jgi:hypothetical protein